ncbi:hypothetical protein MLD38_009782 [Melastoma candidum]|uniref:Uncharacterized protein n=1 Tax=Melastoma candidum TaxID=119954 RepID=A0ACB9S062_9MYRT|nr:hypothetical protein MLD38_009782 [Melastoma candidum]
MTSPMIDQGAARSERELEKGLVISEPSENATAEPSPSPSPSSTSNAPALVLSNSGKRIDQAGRKST